MMNCVCYFSISTTAGYESAGSYAIGTIMSLMVHFAACEFTHVLHNLFSPKCLDESQQI